MLDKRCKYKVRELSDFYLFVKHKVIYYAYYPKQNVTKSTGCTNVHDAYIRACNIYESVKKGRNTIMYKPVGNKSDQYKLNKMLRLIDQSKPLTPNAIKQLQHKLLETGVSGKTANNYICILRKSYQGEFPEWHCVEHKAVYRKCIPIKLLYGFYGKCRTRNDYIAFFAMTTGCRLGEIFTSEPIITEDHYYLRINGTKTKNAVRVIPVLKETLDCFLYIKAGSSTFDSKEVVSDTGVKVGIDTDYINKNNIVFHSFRKCYKTLLESCNINPTWINYYMGHSQTSSVQQLYFIGSSADDSEVYPKVIEALKRFL